MSTQTNDKARRSPWQKETIAVRMPVVTRQKLEAIARREHRSISQQAGLYIDRGITAEESTSSEVA